MNAKMYKIEIYRKVGVRKDGGKFFYYITKGSDGVWYNVKFRRSVRNVPDLSGTLYVRSDKLSVDRRGEFPTIWIHEIENFEPYNPLGDTFEVVEA